MPFQFRFASILRLRLHERDEARQSIATTLIAIDDLTDQLQSLQQQQSDIHRKANLDRVGHVSVETLQSIERHDAHLSSQQQAIALRRTELEKQLTDQQSELIVAQLEVKRFEKLQESDLTKFRAQQKRNEQRESDDWPARVAEKISR